MYGGMGMRIGIACIIWLSCTFGYVLPDTTVTPTETPVIVVFETPTPEPLPTPDIATITQRMSDLQDIEFRINLFVVTFVCGMLILLFLKR